MNKRLSRILLLAFVIALGCSYLVYRILGRQAAVVAQPTTSKIMVPAHDLGIGTVIKDADLKEGQWVGAPPKNTLITKESIVGRGVISTLYEGEPILDSRLAPAGSGGGMAATIPPGMRAVAVRVDDVVGVSGFVIAGTHVDVLITGTPPGGSTAAGPEVKTLLQNVEVLSAGTNIQKDNEGKPVQVPVVNLLLSPEQSEILSLASTQTHIQMVLRNPLDKETTKTPGVAVAGLFNGGEAPPKPKVVAMRPAAPKAAPNPPPPPPVVTRVFMVEVMNGGKKSEQKFATTDNK